jgi:hypothetical protein
LGELVFVGFIIHNDVMLPIPRLISNELLSSVIFVLLPFLNPLLWAFLFGAMLFPFKKKLSFAINSWIDDIERDEIPIAVGLIMCPFNGLEKLGEVITLWLINHFKVLFIGSGLIILLRLIVAFVPAELFSAVFSLIKWQHSLFGAIVGSLSLTLVVVCVVSYAIAVNLLWTSSSSNLFTVAGQSMVSLSIKIDGFLTNP